MSTQTRQAPPLASGNALANGEHDVKRTFVRAAVIVVAAVHGLIHLLAAAKGLGWADVPEIAEPISPAAGAVWLVAGVLVIMAGVLVAVAARWWWILAAVAAVVSQAVIITAWGDAAVGTAANVMLLLAAGYGYSSEGPRSYRAEYRGPVVSAYDWIHEQCTGQPRDHKQSSVANVDEASVSSPDGEAT